MPREHKPLGSFDRGIICAMEPEDTPVDAAYWSKDVDPAYGIGGLIGRPADGANSSGAVAVPFLGCRDYAWIIRKDGKYDLVYNGINTTEKIRILGDFYGSPVHGTDLYPTTEPPTWPTSERTCLISNDKEVRSGFYGATTNESPKWYGYIDYGQFGGSAPTTINTADAQCSAPSLGAFFYKVANNGGYTYGVNYKGNYIYKIADTTGAETAKSTAGQYFSLQGLCWDSGTSTLWVYDKNSEYGTLYKVNTTTLAPTWTCPLSSFVCDPLGEISDIESDGTRIWFGLNYPDYQELPDEATVATFITIPTGSAIINVGVNIVPVGGVGLTNRSTYKIRCLVGISATQMGWFSLGSSSTYLTAGILVYNSSKGLDGSIVSAYNLAEMSGLIYSSSHLYYCGQGIIFKDDVASLPTSGSQVIATTDGTTPYAQSDYLSGTINSLSQLVSSTLYMTHTALAGGVDSISTSLASLASIYAIGNVQLSVVVTGGVGGFVEETTSFYKISYVYDGYQHSVLTTGSQSVYNGKGVTSDHMITVSFAATTNALFSDRISAVCVWRATCVGKGAVPTENYRLVYTQSVTGSSGWTTTGGTQESFSFIDGNTMGSTYYEITGIGEIMTSNFINWGIGVIYGNQLFVGKCTHPELTDASHMLFRSKRGRPDCFDWANDYLKLPEIPKAIATYGGRIFVFATNTVYKIDPEQFYVEDIISGVGVYDQRSVCVTDHGMYCADYENVYMYDGRDFIPVGAPIRTCPQLIGNGSEITAFTTGWTGITHTNFSPQLAYSSRLQALLILVSTGSATAAVLVYTPPRQGLRQYGRWDHWTVAFAPSTYKDLSGIVIGKSGEAYYSNSVAELQFCNGSRMACTHYTGHLTMGTPTQNKRFYWALASSDGTAPTMSYDQNNGATTYTALSSGKIPDAYNLKKYLKLKFVTTAGTNLTRSCDVIFRHLIGFRTYT